MSTGLHTVHVRVNDAATGRPTPVRIRFTDAAGKYYAPFGRLTEFATGPGEDVGGNLQLGDKSYAYIDGNCEILLPAGLISVEIHKGPEYKSIQQDLALSAGKMALRFTLERWINLRQVGWYSGDIRAHALTPQAALLEGAAEDLAVVNLLARDTTILGSTENLKHDALEHANSPVRRYPAIENILSFSGQRPALEMPGHIVVVNTYNRHTVLGKLALLNCHRVVYPLTAGDSPAFADWTLADWCQQCHRKGGLVIGEPVLFTLEGEGFPNLVLGNIDALETGPPHASLWDESWQILLDAGIRFPLVAGSGKTSNRDVLGHTRTFARLADVEEFNYRNWIEAIRAGRTFVTQGPVMMFQVNGKNPGETVTLSSVSEPLRAKVEARSASPFDTLELLVNDKVVSAASSSGRPVTAAIETELSMPEGGWLAARCRGKSTTFAQPLFTLACTSPISVQIATSAGPSAHAGANPFVKHLDNHLRELLSRSRFVTDKFREHIINTFEQAKNELCANRLYTSPKR